MKLSRILSFSCMSLLLMTGLFGRFWGEDDAGNLPSPIDGKTFEMTIHNNTGMDIKISFFQGNRKQYRGVVLGAGKQDIFRVEGRYNKKNAYFRFRRPGKEFKGTGFRFYYKSAAKEKRVKIDEIFLLKDEDGNIIVSANNEINPVTTILRADIEQKLMPEQTKKHKKSGKGKKKDRKKEKQVKQREDQEQRSRVYTPAHIDAAGDIVDL